MVIVTSNDASSSSLSHLLEIMLDVSWILSFYSPCLLTSVFPSVLSVWYILGNFLTELPVNLILSSPIF